MHPNRRQHLTEGTFPAQLDQLCAISEFITAAARRQDMGKRDIFALQMAVDEAATNIIMHGYGEEGAGSIRIACWKEADDFIVELRDRARRFDPSTVPEPDLHNPLEERREGGLGIYLMRRMMDRVDFARQGEDNVLTMVRHCTPSAGPAAGTAVVSPKGRIDATNSPQLERMLREPLEAGQRSVVVDLSQVTYLSSSGLRVLLIAAKELHEHGGNLLLCCPLSGVARVLRMTGFAEIFPLYQTREAALHALEVGGGSHIQE
jgi:anti-anti-sigma factor